MERILLYCRLFDVRAYDTCVALAWRWRGAWHTVVLGKE